MQQAGVAQLDDAHQRARGAPVVARHRRGDGHHRPPAHQTRHGLADHRLAGQRLPRGVAGGKPAQQRSQLRGIRGDCLPLSVGDVVAAAEHLLQHIQVGEPGLQLGAASGLVRLGLREQPARHRLQRVAALLQGALELARQQRSQRLLVRLQLQAHVLAQPVVGIPGQAPQSSQRKRQHGQRDAPGQRVRQRSTQEHARDPCGQGRAPL